MKILVTGGAGYIGSHACIELLEAGHDVVVVDNLCNSSMESIKRVNELSQSNISFYEVDIRNKTGLAEVFSQHSIDSVIHFAGLKAVGESQIKPLQYFSANIAGTCILLEVMNEFCCKKLVFSSSATVYGNPEIIPVKENSPLSATNIYGRTKLIIEKLLQDLFSADDTWHIGILRYFNPVGAHKSGLIGEDPSGVPNNLMPYITQVAVGKLPKLRIFGNDYDTADGTGVRDYIHVVDLARGHLKALQALAEMPQIFKINLGTGRGYSVLEMVKAFEKSSGKKVSFEIAAKRPGDIGTCYADPSYALEKLGWEAEMELNEMCEDAWRWQLNNPDGYK
tara:strand:- start:2176 stop:3186 length:1011 start_codon:yes stop_codon:yes gene_type:complete